MNLCIGYSDGGQKMDEEYVPGSSIYDLLIKEKVKLITFFKWSLVSKILRLY